MSDQEQDKPGGGAGAGNAGNMVLSLDSLEHTREDLANMTRRYLRGEVTDNRYRCFVYGCNSLTKLLVHAKAKELEARIATLEKARQG